MVLLQRLQSKTELQSNNKEKKVPYSAFLCPMCDTTVTKKHNDGINAKTCGSVNCIKKLKEQQNRIKYHTFKMKLLEDLGIVSRITKSGNTKNEHMVILECPACNCSKTVTITEATRQNSCGKPECVKTTRTTKAGNQGNNKTHGMSDTKLYNVWRAMIQRCKSENKSNPKFKNYAGKGISVCKDWQTFDGFYEDMGNRYEEFIGNKPSIDRIDANGNYELRNCEWVEHTTNSIKDQVIPVVQFTKSGKMIARFSSSAEAGRIAIGIGGCTICDTKVNAVCNGKRLSTGGTTWKFEKHCTEEELRAIADADWSITQAPIKPEHAAIGKTVVTLSYPGMVEEGEYRSYQEAAKAIGIDSKSANKINEVCNRKRSSVKGHTFRFVEDMVKLLDNDKWVFWDTVVKIDCSAAWKWFDEFDKDTTAGALNKINCNKPWSTTNCKTVASGYVHTSKVKRRVVQLTGDSKVVHIYDSIVNAQNATGIDSSNISAVCNGKRKTTGGFVWKFMNK